MEKRLLEKKYFVLMAQEFILLKIQKLYSIKNILTSGLTLGGTMGLPAPNTMLGERSLAGRASGVFCRRLLARLSTNRL